MDRQQRYRCKLIRAVCLLSRTGQNGCYTTKNPYQVARMYNTSVIHPLGDVPEHCYRSRCNVTLQWMYNTGVMLWEPVSRPLWYNYSHLH